MSRDGRDIKEYGHPLTKLKGNYYLRRVTFTSDSSVKKLHRLTTVVDEAVKLPFIRSWWRNMYLDVEGDQDNRVYIATVSKNFLGNLLTVSQGTWRVF